MKSLMRKLTEEELKKPYAKFYFQDLPEPDPTVIEIYKKGPMDWRDALDPENVNELLNPGYHKVETGYCQMPDGTAYIATLYKMPGVTLDMINWWYAWHALEDLRYMIWYPGSHLSIKVTEEGRKKICDPNISPEEKHMNITHIVCEDIMGTGQIPAPHAIPFVDMETLGLDPELYAKTPGITVKGAVSDPNDTTLIPERHRILLHYFRETEDGVELRTRTWRGCTLVNGKKVKMIPDGEKMPVGNIIKLTEHSSQEYTNLARILPELYEMMEGKYE